MSDELDPISESGFTLFWPNVILVLGLLVWFGVQDFSLNNQRSFLQKQLDLVQPNLRDNQNAMDHYKALATDLLQVSQKDQAAAQIVHDAVTAGIFHVQQTAPGAGAQAPAPEAPPVK